MLSTLLKKYIFHIVNKSSTVSDSELSGSNVVFISNEEKLFVTDRLQYFKQSRGGQTKNPPISNSLLSTAFHKFV